MTHAMTTDDRASLGAHIQRLLAPELARERAAAVRALPWALRTTSAHHLAHMWLHGVPACEGCTALQELEADWGAYVLLWPHGTPGSVLAGGGPAKGNLTRGRANRR